MPLTGTSPRSRQSAANPGPPPGRRGGSRRDWGWHPLSPEWARRVVGASAIRPGDLVLDLVLDLGAGHGALSGPLLDAGARVLAVELHPGRARTLTARYGDRYDGRLTVVRTDLRGLRLPRRPFRVVASPPYAAGTDAVRLLLGSDRLLSADLVLQRAAVRRLVARPPGARHTRRHSLTEGDALPRSAFRPSPRVDSSVLRIRRR